MPPTDSLNPRFTAERAIVDPILRMGSITGREALRARCEELARLVGLPVELIDRFPHRTHPARTATAGLDGAGGSGGERSGFAGPVPR